MGEHRHPEITMHTHPLAEYMVHRPGTGIRLANSWSPQPGKLPRQERILRFALNISPILPLKALPNALPRTDTPFPLGHSTFSSVSMA
jgi:hypothetical protein